MSEKTDLANENRLTLTLERGNKGLGFNIKGGSDAPYITGDSGVFISKIKKEGAAASDGRLKVGDRIIEVNGKNLENVQHSVAVDTFLNAGQVVTITVLQQHEFFRVKRKGPEKSRGFPYHVVIPMAFGVALAGAIYLFRSRYLV